MNEWLAAIAMFCNSVSFDSLDKRACYAQVTACMVNTKSNLAQCELRFLGK